MNAKKLHEVKSLSAVIDRLSKAVHATHIIDVGAGQGYLAQVLAFEYGLPVVALDACAHHAEVTNKRSGRIQKHYIACARKSKQDCTNVTGPQTATFRVSQMDLQHFLCNLVPEKVPKEVQNLHRPASPHGTTDICRQCSSWELFGTGVRSYVLAGLHACGDLSAMMIRTYLSCNEVKALVTVGCCYNLLSEQTDEVDALEDSFGFPLSEGVKEMGLSLGRRARDLACQSAERWKDVGKESATYNFEQHALRAGFQMVLRRYHPAVAESNPTIGRLGKARRRKQAKRHATACEPSSVGTDMTEAPLPWSLMLSPKRNCSEDALPTHKHHDEGDVMRQRREFVEFCHAAFARLGLESLAEDELEKTWMTIEPLAALVGPYWSLRAVLGPVLETYILLDRLLYLQEQTHSVASCANMPPDGFLEPKLVAVFDPNVSPRNMAIIALKRSV